VSIGGDSPCRVMLEGAMTTL